MNESGYTRSISTKVKSSLAWKILDPYQSGVPDTFYEGQQRDLWIEYKYLAKIPKRLTTLVDLTGHKKFLSKKQQAWLKRRHQTRQDAWVILGSPLGGLVFKDLEWMHPFPTSFLLENVKDAHYVAKTISDYINK